MGIIFVPIMLALVIHLLLGFWLSALGIFQQQFKLQAIFKLTKRISLLFIPSFFLPILFCTGRSIDFAFIVLLYIIGSLIIIYGWIKILNGDFLENIQKNINLDYVANFVAGGLFPVSWLLIGDWLQLILNINFRY